MRCPICGRQVRTKIQVDGSAVIVAHYKDIDSWFRVVCLASSRKLEDMKRLAGEAAQEEKGPR